MTGMAGPGGPMHAAPGAYQTYSAYSGYPAASVDPMWSYFTAIAGQVSILHCGFQVGIECRLKLPEISYILINAYLIVTA